MKPTAIVQIHYHNRPGGVTRVMQAYASLFRRIYDIPKNRNVIVCSAVETDQNNLHKTFVLNNIVACDYHQFRSLNSFYKELTYLRTKLINIIDKFNDEKCLIIGHNMNMGKNCALSVAFTDIVSYYGYKYRHKFISVIHDLPEEGRVSQLRQIEFVARTGIPIEKLTYPMSKNLGYIVLNKRNKIIMKAAGINTTILPNNISTFTPINGSNNKHITTKKMETFTNRRKKILGRKQKIAICPVRGILRKNLAEAILFVSVLRGDMLIIGASGSKTPEKKFYALLVKLCKDFSLPVKFGFDSLFNSSKKMGISEGYLACDYAVTTSLAEGFGYTLFEPWIYGLSVEGRRPMGIGSKELLDFSYLYNQFHVPIQLININVLVMKYYTLHKKIALRSYSFKDFSTHFLLTYCQNGFIDFGILDSVSQIKVIRSICCNIKIKECVLIKNQKKLTYTDKSDAKNQIRKNRALVINNLSGDGYQSLFKRRFHAGMNAHKHSKYKGSFVLRNYFSQMSNLRILMSE